MENPVFHILDFLLKRLNYPTSEEFFFDGVRIALCRLSELRQNHQPIAVFFLIKITAKFKKKSTTADKAVH